MSRDIRDALIVYTSKDGFVHEGFTVVPCAHYARVGRGHYVLVPVLNEQAGEAMLADLKRMESDKAMGQPNTGHE